jgi:hypothetical protein
VGVTPVEVKGHTGTVRFDGRTITIIRRGFVARATVGKGEKQIPLAHVTAVQFKPAGPMMNGFIQFTVGGSVERRSRFGRQSRDAIQDENSVAFHYAQRKAFEELRDVVQAALAEYHAAGDPREVRDRVAAATIPEQIKQLSELRDLGAITDTEFEAKKADLLTRM